MPSTSEHHYASNKKQRTHPPTLKQHNKITKSKVFTYRKFSFMWQLRTFGASLFARPQSGLISFAAAVGETFPPTLLRSKPKKPFVFARLRVSARRLEKLPPFSPWLSVFAAVQLRPASLPCLLLLGGSTYRRRSANLPSLPAQSGRSCALVRFGLAAKTPRGSLRSPFAFSLGFASGLRRRFGLRPIFFASLNLTLRFAQLNTSLCSALRNADLRWPLSLLFRVRKNCSQPYSKALRKIC